MDQALKLGRDHLEQQRFFDGVQVVNAAMEALEQRIQASLPEGTVLGAPGDILRTPEAFVQKVMPQSSEAQHAEIASGYALRTELLVGLGAHKRALVDLGAALTLRPKDDALLALRTRVDGGMKDTASGAASAKTPTTIITGFLGAGKTTLLNNILQEHHGKKIAVIENEFGEVGIDDSLLKTTSSVTEENIIEMNNGCICCTIRGDLISGLKKIHKNTTGKGKPLDGIIIETTGLADPAPVAQTFFADDFVQANMVLDGILTVVDAKHVLEHLRDVKPDGIVNEAVQQVAFADRILLNKTDLVSSDELEEVQGEIRAINKTVAIRRTENSKVDMDFIIGIQAFSLDKVLEQVSDGFLDEEEHGHSHGAVGHGHGHSGHGQGHSEDCGGCDDAAHGGHGGGHEGHESHGARGHGHDEACAGCDDPVHTRPKKKMHQHDYRVTSVGIESDLEMQKDKLDAFISWLMQEKGPDLFRSKGVFAVKGMPNKFVFQAVHMQFDGKPQELWKEGEKRCCKMVFIGKSLNREELNKRFQECLVK